MYNMLIKTIHYEHQTMIVLPGFTNDATTHCLTIKLTKLAIDENFDKAV